MLNCRNILIVLFYIYLMMYVIKKSNTTLRIITTLAAVCLLFFQYEGFVSGYDGIEFKMKHVSQDLINPSRKLSALLGTGYVPLKDTLANDQKDKMFLFKDNFCSPSCCPSTYSCDSGCVCTTDQQNSLGRSQGNQPKPSEDILS